MSGRRALNFAVSAAFAWVSFSAGTALAQDAAIIYGKTFRFVENGQNCMGGGCLPFSEQGRSQVLNNGKILYFFGNGHGGYQSQGIALELGRTVNLGSGGRLPRGFRMSQLTDLRKTAQLPIVRYISELTSRGGTGTATFDGRRIRAVLDLDFSGPVRDGGTTIGTGTAHWQIVYVFEIDGAGRLTGGSGNIRVDGAAEIAGNPPIPLSATGNSTLSPI